MTLADTKERVAQFERLLGDPLLEDGMTEKMKLLEDKIVVLRRALNNPITSEEGSLSKIKVTEPKEFNGKWNAKEFENFLWDMELCFKVARISEKEHMIITSMYLTSDAKLWWRTNVGNALSACRPSIVMWESLKKELKDQCLPYNTSWLARENLKKLKQTGYVKNFVKEFSSLMMDIHNMLEEDKLFNFMSGLQT
ncbi:hypothetical protein Dsin_005220 [Dipteronia sinensis]|uniref:Retrotransposon gag domain-containing protein n=1 Tax=Dipteronia sinensis TaxID=43782 RepID=A0AAE0AW82_9ROSI|nr:hypothetical protein Dsin_005220 [Dipteronia sinensis]